MDALRLEIKQKLELLEVLLGKKIEESFIGLMVMVIVTAATLKDNKSKLNEAYQLYKYLALETYGDAILDLFVCEMFFKEEVTQATMTIQRSKLVSNIRFQEVGKSLLENILVIRNYQENDKITFAKALERLIGAIHLAYGIDFTKDFIKQHGILI